MSASSRPPMWVLTGLSGAGRHTALLALEAAGCRCVDNLPIALLGELGGAEPPPQPVTVAVVDARQGAGLADWDRDATGVPVKVLFLDARDEVLVRRLADSVRPHPCANAGRGLAAVRAERILLEPLRADADVVLDSSDLSATQLGSRVVETVGSEGSSSTTNRGFVCTVSSFGFKYGSQPEADWLIDVRFLRNPFWDPELRPLTGRDRAVQDYIWGDPEAATLVDRLAGLLEWVIGRSAAHGRTRLHVAIGCTGGRHRSVAVAESLAGRLAGEGVDVEVRHRDVERPEPR
ncbi:MAG: RNase adapter RapZ [Candidatus Dormibacteria bacterium]